MITSADAVAVIAALEKTKQESARIAWWQGYHAGVSGRAAVNPYSPVVLEP